MHCFCFCFWTLENINSIVCFLYVLVKTAVILKKIINMEKIWKNMYRSGDTRWIAMEREMRWLFAAKSNLTWLITFKSFIFKVSNVTSFRPDFLPGYTKDIRFLDHNWQINFLEIESATLADEVSGKRKRTIHFLPWSFNNQIANTNLRIYYPLKFKYS